jgi:hypothetical protein
MSTNMIISGFDGVAAHGSRRRAAHHEVVLKSGLILRRLLLRSRLEG